MGVYTKAIEVNPNFAQAYKNRGLTLGLSNLKEIAGTSAVFPKELCRKILKYYSFRGDVVLDRRDFDRKSARIKCVVEWSAILRIVRS